MKTAPFPNVRCVLLSMARGLVLLGLAAAGPAGRIMSGQLRTVSAAPPVIRVQGEACTDACRRDHSNCMIREKGSPGCNTRLQRCLEACLAGKRRP
jgi:hypothetical protein